MRTCGLRFSARRSASPSIDGRLTLGTWQQVLFLDFDVRPRQREVLVQVVGETRG